MDIIKNRTENINGQKRLDLKKYNKRLQRVIKNLENNKYDQIDFGTIIYNTKCKTIKY